MSALIGAEELYAALNQPGIKVLDASYNLPPSSLGIPGAVDFDIDDIADPAAAFAHTVPSPELFAAKIGALGIDNNSTVIVYDRSGIAMSAARAWWMFRLFGHDNVRVLDGGLPAWIKAGYRLIEKFSIPFTPAHFTPGFRPELLKNVNQVAENISQKTFTLLDARDARRYNGEVPDPRPHAQSGHIPGSFNLPYISLLNTDGTLKSASQLEQSFESLPLDKHGDIACTCGSGVTACVIALALHEVGHKTAAVYDGSWTEWGSIAALPKAKGA